MFVIEGFVVSRVTFLVPKLAAFPNVSLAVALKRYWPSARLVKLMKLGEVEVVLEFI